jgi:hypothetical protein
MPRPRRLRRILVGVSIHAPRCRGAMPTFRNLWKRLNKMVALREPLAHERKQILLALALWELLE